MHEWRQCESCAAAEIDAMNGWFGPGHDQQPQCEIACRQGLCYKPTMMDTNQIDRSGVNLTEERVLGIGHIFREQTISDYGIDAQIEIKKGANGTGRLIAVQIKSGPSYFEAETENGYWLPISDRHRNLWVNHSLPVIVVLCDLVSRVCYYEEVRHETCVRAGENWKILVPKTKAISAHSSSDLATIASPVVAASEYSIHAEQDNSHANARRISLVVVVHPGSKAMTKPNLGAIVRAALKQGQASQYHRDKIAERVLGGRSVEVVCGFVYLRDVDRESASWTCRFQWISPTLPPEYKPLGFEGEIDGSGLIIDWKSNADLARFMDERRATKADFLKNVDQLIEYLPNVREKLTEVLEVGDKVPASSRFPDFAAKYQNMWDGSFAAPSECQRLHQAIQELLAIVGNAGLIWGQRSSRSQAATRSLMEGCQDQLDRLTDEISFLRRDVQ